VVKLFDYDLNYIYVFCNELDFNSLVHLQDPKEKDYKIVGFKEKQNVFVISLMINDMNFKWCHQFKCNDKNEKIVYQTEIKNGNFDMNVDFEDIEKNCDYISLIGGLESDFDF
jgi:hypothetical protein